jgi:hypothetical protein
VRPAAQAILGLVNIPNPTVIPNNIPKVKRFINELEEDIIFQPPQASAQVPLKKGLSVVEKCFAITFAHFGPSFPPDH